jgi:hypothetical protein
MMILLGALSALPAAASALVGEPLSVAGGQTKKAAGAVLVAQGRSCKAVSSCREAVIMWCGGYSRADADSDGIPCENVCRSKSQVDAIKDEIGC